MHFRRRAKVIFAAIFLLVAAAILLVQTTIDQEMRSVREHAEDSIELQMHKRLHRHIVNAVLAQRAYLLSAKDDFLRKYTAEVNHVPTLLSDLSERHLQESHSVLDPELGRLWFSLKLQMDETIALASQGDLQTAYRLIGLGYGANWLARLQATMNEIELQHSQWHQKQAVREQNIFTWVTGTNFALLVAVLGLLAYLIRGLRYEVFLPLAAMRRHFVRGDLLDDPIPMTFKDQEIDSLRQSFNNLTARARKHKEETWAEAKSKLDLQVRLTREQEEFSSVIAHEVRTPLSTIRSLVDLQKVNGKWPQGEGFNQIDRSLLMLSRLIDSSLEYRQILAGQGRLLPVSFSPLAMLEDVKDHCAAIGHADRDRIQCECKLNAGARLEGDSQKITHILINLVSNALKFSPASGKVTIAVSLVQHGDKTRLNFSVIDQGIGMTEEETLHIFEPFMQASSGVHRKYGGTGLGLAISKRLADCMGASLTVSSFPGRGTRFILDVPVKVLYEQPESEVVKEEVIKLDLSGRNVLMVEDHRLNAKINSHLIHKSFGCSVVWAENMEEAIKLFDQGDFYDLILMDINLGSGMSGLDGSRLLHSRFGSDCPPIVALTAGVTEEQKAGIYAAGMRAVIGKPFSIDVVSQILSRVLHCRQSA